MTTTHTAITPTCEFINSNKAHIDNENNNINSNNSNIYNDNNNININRKKPTLKMR